MKSQKRSGHGAVSSIGAGLTALLVLAGTAQAGETCGASQCAVHGQGGTGALRTPEWIAPVIAPQFDVSFQDMRTQASIQENIARVIADRRFVMTGGDPDDPSRALACFAPGSTPTQEEMAALNEYIFGQVFGERYELLGSSWVGVPNTPTVVTWSLVPDTVSLPPRASGSNENSSMFNRMDALFPGNRALWVAQFQAVFDRWEALTGIDFTRVTASGVDWDDGSAWGTSGNDTTRGDIRIGMRNNDGTNNVLAWALSPSGGGDIIMDRAEAWNASGSSYRFLRNTMMHEVGHAVGLAHICPINNAFLMEPNLSVSFDGLQQDDIRGGHRLYGDIYEPNNSAASTSGTVPSNLGTLGVGVTNIGQTPAPLVTNGAVASLVIEQTPDDTDFYRLSLDEPRLVDVSINPVGSTYDSSPQNMDGSCSSGTAENSRNVANLRLRALTTASVILRTQDAAAVGLAETLPGTLLPSGQSLLQVDASATSLVQVQLYTMSITVRADALAPSASDGTFTDKVRVTWPAIPSASNYQVRRGTTNSAGAATILATLGSGVTSYDDTTAVPGTNYFYWVAASQNAGTTYIITTGATNGEPGFRAVANVSPTANAGPDQVVTDVDNNGSQNVTLNGSGSSDDGTITNYTWRRLGSIIGTGVSPTVSLPWGLNVIELTVTDDDGATGVDTVNVTINRVPVANAGSDITVTDSDNSGAETVTLVGSGSSDPDGTIASYVWRVGPTTVGTGVSPAVSFPVGTRTVDLTVTDNNGATATDSVIVTVNAPSGPVCDSIDFNNDGIENDPTDIEAYLSVYSGGPCVPGSATCNDIDFNNDGIENDPTDIESFLSVYSGGPCL